MESGRGDNQQPGGTGTQFLDQWIPLTPSEPSQPTMNCAQSPMAAPGERIDGSNACHVYNTTRRNVRLMNVLSNMVGMGQTTPYLQLSQSTSAQLGSNINLSYLPGLNPQMIGFNQQMYMANPMILDSDLTGRTFFCNDTFHLSPTMHTDTDIQTSGHNNNPVSQFAPATPDLRAKKIQKIVTTDPANLHMDGHVNHNENNVNVLFHSPCESHNAISQDQCYEFNKKNAFLPQQGSPNLESSSTISQQSILTPSPTCIQPVTPLKKPRNHEGKEECQGNNLCETPPQKQKRKKHRPKVVREVKPKKTHNPATPQKPMREKRKYVRKSTPKGLITTPSDCGESSELAVRKKASCRRALTFNLPDYRSHDSIINGGSCTSAVDNQSDPQLRGRRRSTNNRGGTSNKQADLQSKPAGLEDEDTTNGVGIDLNCSFIPTLKDFRPENSTPFNVIVRAEPTQVSMKVLARRKNMEQVTKQITNMESGSTTLPMSENGNIHVLETQTKSLQNLSTDSNNVVKRLKRGFYETITTAKVNQPDAVENHAHNSTTSKKPKSFLIQKGNTHNAHLTGSPAGSNNYNSQLHHRTIEAQDEHNGGISDFLCKGVSLSSNCQQKCTSIQEVFSSMKCAQSKGPNNISAHIAHPPRIVHEVISCQSSYDELDERLKSLNINEASKVDAEKNKQIVLYAEDKQIVSYEGSVDSIKKKIKPRAKVELDGETLRVWDMLMWNHGGDTTEKVDSTKEKWWAEERGVFKGRVDSFIARMHLVQGDRRFSKWKGSVLDSVVGVFLTQNVSDHLSSSAFMALAAKFPMHPSSRRNDMDRREEISRSSSMGSKWQMTASKQGMPNEHLETPFQENFIIEKDLRSNLGLESSCFPGTLECNSAKMTEENPKINNRSSVENSSSMLSNLNSCNHSTSQMSSGIEVEEMQDMVMSSKLNDVNYAASISFPEHFQILGDVKRTCLDEEPGLSHEKGHKDELYWVGTAQFSTTPDKDEPKVQKDFLNARGLPCVENVTAKNCACQPVCEDVTEVLPVEDVVSSQNSVISSLSSTDSFIHLVNDTSSNVKCHMKENVVSGSCRSIFDEANISFSALLQMQDCEMLQKFHGNNEAIADPSNKYNNGTKHERWRINSDEEVEELSPYKCHRNSYSFCIKEATEPNWRSSEWRCVTEDETRPYLPSSASKVVGFNYVNYTEISHESMNPSSKHATSLPFSTSSCSNNSWIPIGKDVVQPAFEFESWTAEGLQHRLDSGLHSEALESMEGSSCMNGMYSVKTSVAKPESPLQILAGKHVSEKQETQSGPVSQEVKEKFDFHECTGSVGMKKAVESETLASNSVEKLHCSNKSYGEAIIKSKPETKKSKDERKKDIDWDSLRKEVHLQHQKKQRSCETMDSLDYEALRCVDVSEISDTIRARGMNNRLAQRIQDLLNRLMQDHGNMDLEWLRDVPPEKAKEYLLSIKGLGLKSVECVRLLTLHHLAFPVDTNVGRIAVRLGWVPLQPLPESLQLHLLELYPILESVQKYLWPRLCTLDQKTLYELHYQLITFGKVFCTKNKPNCNACPLRAECKHFASAFASARLSLPGLENKSLVSSSVPLVASCQNDMTIKCMPLPPLASPHLASETSINKSGPIIEEPPSPEPENVHISQNDIEEAFWENDPEDIPTIKLNIEEFSLTVQNFMLDNKVELKDVDMSKALVALSVEASSIPVPKLKSISRLRTEHQVYELPDDHTLLSELEPREADDPCPYLLAIWTPGETANSIEPPDMFCSSQGLDNPCDKVACFACNSRREAHTQTVRGTLLVPCRTAMRGSFPLNGTYFQVNEVFADHDSSLDPINVPRALIWNLPRRTVYFGTSVPTIFRGLTTESIQQCFWRGFVCVRGFDRKTRAPRPLMARLHLSASKLAKTNKEAKKSEQGM